MTVKRRNCKTKTNTRKTFEPRRSKRLSYDKRQSKSKNVRTVAKTSISKEHVARKKSIIEKVSSQVLPEEVAVDESAISTQPLSSSELAYCETGHQNLHHNLEKEESKVKCSIRSILAEEEEIMFLSTMEVILHKIFLRMLGQISQKGILSPEFKEYWMQKEFTNEGDDVQLTQSLLLNSNIDKHLTSARIFNNDEPSNLENDEHEQIHEYIRSTVAASCLLSNRSCQVLWGPHGNGQDKLLARLLHELSEADTNIYGVTFTLNLDGSVLNGEEEAIRAIAEQMLVFLQSDKSASLRLRNESIAHGSFDFGSMFHFSEQLCQTNNVNSKVNIEKSCEVNVRLQEKGSSDIIEDDDDNSSSMSESIKMEESEEEEEEQLTIAESGHLIVTNTESTLSGSVANALPALQRALLLFKSYGVNIIVCINNIDRFAVWCDQILYLLSGLMHEVTSTSNSSEILSSIPLPNSCKERKQEQGSSEDYIRAAHKKERTKSAVFREECPNNDKSIKASKNSKSASNNDGMLIESRESVSAIYAKAPTMNSFDSPNDRNGAMVLLLTSSGPDIRHLEKRLSSRLTCETRFVPLLPWTPLSLCTCFVNRLQHIIKNKLHNLYNKQTTLSSPFNKYVSSAKHDKSNVSTLSTTWTNNFRENGNCNECVSEYTANNCKNINSRVDNTKNVHNTHADDKENAYNGKARGRKSKNASLTKGKTNINNKIQKTMNTGSEHENITIIENASENKRAKEAEITTQSSITSCKVVITRIMWELMLIMCNSLEEELKNIDSIDNNNRNTNDKNNKSVNVNTLCAHDKFGSNKANTYGASNDNSLSITKSLATRLHDQTFELTLSGAVMEMVLFALFTSLRQSAHGILDLVNESRRMSHVVWWRARLVEAYTLLLSSSSSLSSQTETMRYFIFTQHIKEVVTELSNELDVSIECDATTLSPVIAERWAKIIHSVSSSFSSYPLALYSSLVKQQEENNVLHPSTAITQLSTERNNNNNNRSTSAETNKNNNNKSSDVNGKSEEMKMSVVGSSNNANYTSLECIKLATRPHCESSLTLESPSPPDLFDLLEYGQMLTNGYFSKEMFMLYVQLYVHEESYSSTVPVQRVNAKSKSPLTSSSSWCRTVKDLIEDVGTAMGTQAAAAMDVEAYYLAMQHLQQYKLITVTEGSQLVSLTHSLTRAREFIHAILQERRHYCEEILGLEAKEYVRLRSIIEG